MDKNAWQYALNYIKYTNGVEGEKSSEELKLFLKKWISGYKPLGLLISKEVDQKDNSIIFDVWDRSLSWKQKIKIFRDNKIKVYSVEHSDIGFGKFVTKFIDMLNKMIEETEKRKRSLSKEMIIDTVLYEPISKRTRLNSKK